ncbi:MAG: Eco57I restriction-modification methylase domain-containing protein, partial [Mycoplasma sp.]
HHIPVVEKNKSISNTFIEKSIELLKENGFLCFITPNNWMSYNNNNTTLKRLLNEGNFIMIDNDCKKYFGGVGSSFTILI